MTVLLAWHSNGIVNGHYDFERYLPKVTKRNLAGFLLFRCFSFPNYGIRLMRLFQHRTTTKSLDTLCKIDITDIKSRVAPPNFPFCRGTSSWGIFGTDHMVDREAEDELPPPVVRFLSLPKHLCNQS